MKVILLRTIKILVIGIFALYALIWFSSPLAIQKVVQEQLAPLGLSLHSDSHIRYNPFLSSISIKSLSVTKEEQPVFALEQLTIELNLYMLLFKQLEVKSFNISGLRSNIIVKDEKITIAGIELPATKVSKSDEKQDNSKNTLADYQLRMPAFHLTESALELTINQQRLQLDLTAVTIEYLIADMDNQSMQMAVALAIDNSTIELESEIELSKGQGEIYSSLELKKLDLAQLNSYLPSSIKSVAGQLSFKGKQKIVLDQSGTLITLSDNEQMLEQFAMVQKDIELALAQQTLTTNEFSVTIAHSNEVNVSGDAQLTIKEIEATNQQNKQLVLMKAEQLLADNILISTVDDIPHIAIEQLQLKDSVISDNLANELPALTTFDQLAIKNIQLNENALALESMTLSGLNIDAQIATDKTLTSLEALNLPTETNNTEDSQAQTPAVTENVNEATTPVFQFSLNEFSLTNPANLHFLDQSVEPSYQRNFTINQLTLTDVDSKKPEQESKLLLSGSSNEYAKFELTSINKPFAKLPYYSVKGFINELSLPAVSSYIKQALNHEIKSGQLNLAIDTELLGTDISGEANILLRGIDFTSANDHQANSLKDQTAIPFSMALGMLKDSKGNVELNIPLAGDTSDPSFGVGGFFTLIVKQATMMAAKDYLMTTFVPYANVVSIAMTAGEYLLKVRFNDMVFAPGVADMESHHQSFLNEFSQLMRDKPDTQITLCGISTPADINLSTGKEITDKALINQLTELSVQRAEHFKKLMVDEYKLESARLLLCTPQVDFDQEAKPRLTFSS